jgi:hypothetical protein
MQCGVLGPTLTTYTARDGGLGTTHLHHARTKTYTLNLPKAEKSRLVGPGAPLPADSGNLAAGARDFTRTRTWD